MKCLITNDVHLGIARNDDIWLEQSVKLFQCIIDECHRRNVYTLCILGDFFHDRKNLYMKTLDTAIRIADMLKKEGIYTIYVIGNHDVFHKTENTISPLSMFNEYDNIRIIKEPTMLEGVGFASWGNVLDDNTLNSKYLFGHFEINGFPVTNKMIFDKSQYNASDFSKYDSVITGHFHIPSNRQNITYLGSPYHLNFNDVDSLRGFYFFDDGKLEFIEFDGIKFVYVSSEEIPNPKKIKGNVVRLLFEKDYGTEENNKKIEQIQQHSPLRFFSDFSQITNEVKVDDDKEHQTQTIKSNKEILFDFIDVGEHPEYINTKKMKTIINTLLEEI